MKFGIEILPVNGGPLKVVTLNVPPVRPVNEPVCRAGAGGGNEAGVLKVLLNMMEFAVTATPPPMFATPVIEVANIGTPETISPKAPATSNELLLNPMVVLVKR
jgi:hypothetical protein